MSCVVVPVVRSSGVARKICATLALMRSTKPCTYDDDGVRRGRSVLEKKVTGLVWFGLGLHCL